MITKSAPKSKVQSLNICLRLVLLAGILAYSENKPIYLYCAQQLQSPSGLIHGNVELQHVNRQPLSSNYHTEMNRHFP